MDDSHLTLLYLVTCREVQDALDLFHQAVGSGHQRWHKYVAASQSAGKYSQV